MFPKTRKINIFKSHDKSAKTKKHFFSNVNSLPIYIITNGCILKLGQSWF